MNTIRILWTIALALAAARALGGEAAKTPPPTWPWPGPTPAEQREVMLKSTFVMRPTPADLKEMERLSPEKPPAVPQRPRKLLCWGRLWTHMANPMTEAAVKILGQKTGAFEVVATDDPQMLLPERLKDFDALFFNGLHDRYPFLPHWWKTMPKDQQDAAQDLDRKVKQGLLKFVAEDGKGIAAIEGAIAAHQDWKEWGELMGAFYAGHYTGNFVIKALDPAHPLTACFDGQPLRTFDNAYVPGAPYSRKKVRVLLALDLTQTPEPIADPKSAWLKPSVQKLEETTGRKEYPISWVKAYGKGRVFYASQGVQKQPYSNSLFLRYLLGGLQFALGDLPADVTPSEK
jgi:type 1 glutamine amidotransferase